MSIATIGMTLYRLIPAAILNFQDNFILRTESSSSITKNSTVMSKRPKSIDKRKIKKVKTWDRHAILYLSINFNLSSQLFIFCFPLLFLWNIYTCWYWLASFSWIWTVHKSKSVFFISTLWLGNSLNDQIDATKYRILLHYLLRIFIGSDIEKLKVWETKF